MVITGGLLRIILILRATTNTDSHRIYTLQKKTNLDICAQERSSNLRYSGVTIASK